MKLDLFRIWPTDECTIGELHVDGEIECFTLEDMVREQPGVPVEAWKLPGETAIPRGLYRVTVTPSERFGRELPLLVGVPGFAGVRIHPGNTAADTEGCILVGASRGPNCIYDSRKAFAPLFERIQAALAGGDQVWISVS